MNLRLNRHVQSRGRLVGDQQLGLAGERHGDHHPLPHTAAQFMGIAIRQRLRRRQTDQLQDMLGEVAGDFFRMAHVDLVTFADLRADGERRVERSHRLLKDHRDFAPADFFHLARAFPEQIFALKDHLALGNLAGGDGNQAQNRERRHAFAAAGFADDPEGFTLRERKRKIPDRRSAYRA